MKWEKLRPGHYLANHDGQRFEIWRTCAGYYQCAAYENADTPYAFESFGTRTLAEAKEALIEIASGATAPSQRD